MRWRPTKLWPAQGPAKNNIRCIWCIFLQQYRILMDIGNSKNYLGIHIHWEYIYAYMYIYAYIHWPALMIYHLCRALLLSILPCYVTDLIGRCQMRTKCNLIWSISHPGYISRSTNRWNNGTSCRVNLLKWNWLYISRGLCVYVLYAPCHIVREHQWFCFSQYNGPVISNIFKKSETIVFTGSKCFEWV